MKKTVREIELIEEKENKKEALRVVEEKLSVLWKDKGKEDNLVAKAIEEVFQVFPEAMGFKVRCGSLRKEYRSALDNHRSCSPPGFNSWDEDANEKELLRDAYYKQERVLDNKFGLKNKNLFSEIDKYLVILVDKSNLAEILLLAYGIGRAPQGIRATTLYEGQGYDYNRKQKEWEDQLGISQFFADGTYSDGDRYHGYAEGALITAVKTVAPDLVEEFLKIPAKIEELEKKQKRLELSIFKLGGNIKGYDFLRRYGYDTVAVERVMPWLIEEIASTFDLRDLNVLLDEGVAVLLSHLSHTQRGRGVERESHLVVFRGVSLNKEEKFFKYRDAHSESADDSSLCFEKIVSVGVGDSTVTVELKSNNWHPQSVEMSLTPHKQVEVGMLSFKEQADWLAVFETVKNQLLEQNFLPEAQMPIRALSRFSDQHVDGGVGETQIPYERSRVVDEHIDAQQGRGAIVVKSQIDCVHAQGRQYSWRSYVVDSFGESQSVDYQTAWELDLRNGQRVEINARDLLSAG